MFVVAVVFDHQCMSAMLAQQEEMPQVFTALRKRLDKEFDSDLEREDLIDLIAGAYPKDFDDIVKTLTQGRNLDLDLEGFGPRELAEFKLTTVLLACGPSSSPGVMGCLLAP